MTFKCEKCEKEFDEKTSFDQHTVAKHSPEAEKKESEKKVKKQTPNKSGGGKGKYIIGVLIVLLIAYGVYSASTAPPAPVNPNVPSGSIHWHPTLEIIINGEKQIIPAEVGIGAVHQPVHTHKEDNLQGVLHIEAEHPTDDIMKLGFFFRVWGKVLNENCIFEFCNDGNKTMKMTVNGKSNSDFENYYMKDGDKIVIEYS